MLTFLFWNIRKKQSAHLVAALAHEHDVNIVLLAECQDPPRVGLALTPEGASRAYNYYPSKKIQVFSRLPRNSLVELDQNNSYLDFWQLEPPHGQQILLVAVHLPDRYNTPTDHERYRKSREFIAEIQQHERKIEHRRTVIVGDFNMNPYEVGMFAADGFNALSSRTKVENRRQRRTSGMPHFFYNPMWNHLGDVQYPPGTYYFEGKPTELDWHTLDQVLVRPDLLDSFESAHVKIVTKAGDEDLINHLGRPNKDISDHLPILFKLDL